MKIGFIRQLFRPFAGLEHGELTTRFLYVFLVATSVVEVALLIFRLLFGESLFSTTVIVLMSLLVVQLTLFVMVKRGYTDAAALCLVILAWAAITYQAWTADGVRDAVVYVYVLVIFIAALTTSWQISTVLFLLSIGAIWFFAIAEARGLRLPHMDAPVKTAGDLTAIFTVMFLLILLLLDMVRHSLNAVRQGEDKFRKVFDVSPAAITISALEDGRLIHANHAYWKLSGLSPSFALGKTTVELGTWNDYLQRAAFVNKLKEKKSVHDPEYRFRNQAGEERVTLAFYELIDLETGPAVMSMFYDITEQKTAQLALQASEQKYRNFIEQSMEGIWFLAFDQPIPTSLPAEEQVDLIYKHGYISECNDVLAHMYGYSSSVEMHGVRLLALQGGDQPDKINYGATLKLVREGYRSGNRETREQTRDGKTVYFLNNAVGVIQADSLIGLWGTQLDITALKNTEEALRRSEARTRAVLDAVPDMIFEFMHDGTIIQFIPSTTNTPLIPPEQFLGKNIREVLPSVADQTIFAIERALESGHVHAFEYELQDDGEKRTFEARFTKLSADSVLAMVRDVSIQKWIESEREKLINELELKNAELERFTYTVSHDLKSPLITIKGFLGFLHQDAHTGNLKRLDSDLQRIGDAADKMQTLLNDLLELSRVGRMVNQLQNIDLNKMVAEVLELLHGRIHAGNIRVVVAENLPTVHGDRQRLFEVLQNLVDNACKFMGEQVDPCIEIGQADVTETGAPILFVQDNGIGIDPKYKERIFGLFDKLDPRTQGTGIGLALVKRIIEFHGGRIWVESEPDRGATFYFSLPQADSPHPKGG